MLLLFSKSNMSSVTKRYLIMSKYPYCKINVMKTWAASLRATQNICSDNWNNREFVLTMLVQENIWSFSLNFFLLFLGIINFYIYSSYSFISSITIKNMLHSWKKYVLQEMHCIINPITIENIPKSELQNCTCGCWGAHLHASE